MNIVSLGKIGKTPLNSRGSKVKLRIFEWFRIVLRCKRETGVVDSIFCVFSQMIVHLIHGCSIPKHDNRNFLLLIPMDVGLVAKPLIYLLLVLLYCSVEENKVKESIVTYYSPSVLGYLRWYYLMLFCFEWHWSCRWVQRYLVYLICCNILWRMLHE